MTENFDDFRQPSVSSVDVDAVFDRARARMVSQMATAPSKPAKTMMWWGIGGGIGLVAAATTTAIVLSPFGATAPVIVASPSFSQTATPTESAAPLPTTTAPGLVNPTAPEATLQSVFGQAAGAIMSQEEPAPGQYVKFSVTATRLSLFGDSSASGGTLRQDERGMAEGGFEIVSRWNRYVPEDIAERSVREELPGAHAGNMWGPGAEALVKKFSFGSADGPAYVTQEGPIGMGENVVHDDLLRVMGPVDDLSRNPAVLLQQIEAHFAETVDTPDQPRAIREAIAEALAMNVGPADLRATLMNAAALLSGVELISVEGSTARIYWPVADGADAMHDIITLDTETGYVTTLERWMGEDGDVIPSQVPNSRLDISASVVTEAPASTN